jgi:3D (Asp-Asp-Asp) domain-containing protein
MNPIDCARLLYDCEMIVATAAQRTGKIGALVESRKKASIILSILAIVFSVLTLILLGRAANTGNDELRLRTATRQPLASTVVRLPQEKQVATRSESPIRILLFEITAYSPTVAECDASPTVTASGKSVYEGGVAADLHLLPFGSIVIIPGYNGGEPCTVIDTGGAIHGQKLDVFFWNSHEAVHWGRRRNVQVKILYIPK